MLEKVSHERFLGFAPLFCQALDKGADALALGGPGKHGIHGNAAGGERFRNASRNGQLRGLRHTVMNHFRRNLQSGFARDEDESAPFAFHHPGQIMARRSNPGKNIDFEESQPVIIVDLEERFRLENAEIVDENVHVLDARKQFLDSGQGAEIGGNALGVWSDFRYSFLDTRLGSSIDVDESAFAR